MQIESSLYLITHSSRMLCPESYCREQSHKINDCPDKVWELLSGDFYNNEGIRVFINIYKCNKDHYYAICKKCGKPRYSFLNIYHIIECFGGFNTAGNFICINRKLSDSQLREMRGNVNVDYGEDIYVSIRLHDLIKLVPQFLYIDIKNAFMQCNYDGLEISTKCRVFKYRNSFMEVNKESGLGSIISQVKTMSTVCILCGMKYEAFPVMELIYKHTSTKYCI